MHVAKCLSKILGIHPNMSLVIIKEVEMLIFKPKIPSSLRLQGISFLIKIRMPEQQRNMICEQLLKSFFSLFKIILGEKPKTEPEARCLKERKKSKKENKRFSNKRENPESEIQSKLLTKTLEGIMKTTKALAEKSGKVIEFVSENLKQLYIATYYGSMKVRVLSLYLIFQVEKESGEISERYYRSLYHLLNDPRISSLCSEQHILVNLLFRSLKVDTTYSRSAAFVKRLLQLSNKSPLPLSLAILLLLSHLLIYIPALAIGFHAPEDLDEEETQVTQETQEAQRDINTTTTNNNNMSNLLCIGEYDSGKREPIYSNADKTAYWEIIALTKHYHPTVAIWANKLLNSQPIEYNGISISI